MLHGKFIILFRLKDTRSLPAWSFSVVAFKSTDARLMRNLNASTVDVGGKKEKIWKCEIVLTFARRSRSTFAWWQAPLEANFLSFDKFLRYFVILNFILIVCTSKILHIFLWKASFSSKLQVEMIEMSTKAIKLILLISFLFPLFATRLQFALKFDMFWRTCSKVNCKAWDVKELRTATKMMMMVIIKIYCNESWKYSINVVFEMLFFSTFQFFLL